MIVLKYKKVWILKVVGKWFLFGLLVVVVFLGFLPKEQLFYLAQERLQDNGIVLRYEKMDESPLSLKLSKVKVYISKTPICVSDSVEASLFGIKARGIELLGLIGENFPKRVVTKDFYKRRSYKKAFGEFGIYWDGIKKLYGYNYRLIYPMMRLVTRLMPPFIVKVIYSEKFRKILNK